MSDLNHSLRAFCKIDIYIGMFASDINNILVLS